MRRYKSAALHGAVLWKLIGESTKSSVGTQSLGMNLAGGGRFYLKRELSGDEVYYTNSLILLVKNMLVVNFIARQVLI